jgi:hypothetical protein
MMNNLNIYNQIIKDFTIIKEQIREMAIGVYTFDELVLDQMFFRITSIEKNLYQFLEGVQND